MTPIEQSYDDMKKLCLILLARHGNAVSVTEKEMLEVDFSKDIVMTRSPSSVFDLTEYVRVRVV
jgi:hypothetical protein